MLVPFDMIVVLLAIGCFAEDPPVTHLQSYQTVVMAVASLLICYITGKIVCSIGIKALRKSKRSEKRIRIASMAETISKILPVLIFICLIHKTDLPWNLYDDIPRDSFIFEISSLLLYIAMFLACRIPQYSLHKAVTPGSWTFQQFIIHKIRYNLFVIAAWLPFTFLANWIKDIVWVLPVLFFGGAWCFPWLLARIWGCQKLSDDSIRKEIEALEYQSGASFSEIYLWEPGGGKIQNAAAVGILPPFRYLFITPALLKEMTKDQRDAVIFHELGHIKNKHLLFYLLTTLGAINGIILAASTPPCLTITERFILIGIFSGVYFRFIFGWLSRGMERQADLFSLQIAGTPRGLTNALEKLAIASGGIRHLKSWHHLGISERVAFLRQAAKMPALISIHNKQIRIIMSFFSIMSFMILVGIAVMFVWPTDIPDMPHKISSKLHIKRISYMLAPTENVTELQ